MQGVVASFPEGPVAVGEQWSTRSELTLGFPMVIETVSTLTAREAGRTIITGKGTVRSRGDAGGLALGAAKVRLDISGDVSSVTQVDEVTGWTIHSETTVRFSGTVTLSGLPDQSEDLTFPVSSVSRSVIGSDRLF